MRWPIPPTGRCSWPSPARCWRRRRSRRSRSTASTRPTWRARSTGWPSSTARSSKTHSGIYRDLAVRHRQTEGDAILGPVETPLVSCTLELIHAIEDGRAPLPARQPRPAGGLRAAGPAGRAAERGDVGDRRARPRRRPARWPTCRSRSRTTSTSPAWSPPTPRQAGVPGPAAARRRAGGRLRAAGAELFCKTNLLEYAAGSVNPGLRHDLQPPRSGPHLGRLQQRLGGAGGAPASATTRSAPTPAARSGSRPATAASSG